MSVACETWTRHPLLSRPTVAKRVGGRRGIRIPRQTVPLAVVLGQTFIRDLDGAERGDRLCGRLCAGPLLEPSDRPVCQGTNTLWPYRTGMRSRAGRYRSASTPAGRAVATVYRAAPARSAGHCLSASSTQSGASDDEGPWMLATSWEPLSITKGTPTGRRQHDPRTVGLRRPSERGWARMVTGWGGQARPTQVGRACPLVLGRGDGSSWSAAPCRVLHRAEYDGL